MTQEEKDKLSHAIITVRGAERERLRCFRVKVKAQDEYSQAEKQLEVASEQLQGLIREHTTPSPL